MNAIHLHRSVVHARLGHSLALFTNGFFLLDRIRGFFALAATERDEPRGQRVVRAGFEERSDVAVQSLDEEGHVEASEIVQFVDHGLHLRENRRKQVALIRALRQIQLQLLQQFRVDRDLRDSVLQRKHCFRKRGRETTDETPSKQLLFQVEALPRDLLGHCVSDQIANGLMILCGQLQNLRVGLADDLCVGEKRTAKRRGVRVARFGGFSRGSDGDGGSDVEPIERSKLFEEDENLLVVVELPMNRK